MAGYDSDSSGAEDVGTDVLLGYASRELTSDNFSQLGGHPTWLDNGPPPNGGLAKCKVCNGFMSLLIQLYADLPKRFPSHERRLYVWACRRKACRRKQGSTRGFRAIRYADATVTGGAPPEQPVVTGASPSSKPAVNPGETLFGVKSLANGQTNPFATVAKSGGAINNPFASTPTQSVASSCMPAATDPLSETFAQKARISSPMPNRKSEDPVSPEEPWPQQNAFPQPYPAYYIDADKEYLEPESQTVPSNARLDRNAANDESSSSLADNKAAFESSMDKTFQRFADRLAQNPEQVLRYEYGRRPLLYSRTDTVGKLLDSAPEHGSGKVQIASSSHSSGTMAKVPRCENCGAARSFELQLTPHAVTELEADEMSIDGMDWGTVILAVCRADCQQRGKKDGELGYVEEWVGVQWEELAGKRP